LNPLSFLDYLRTHVRLVTALSYIKRIKSLSKITDINDPVKVKNVICSYPCKNSRKQLLADAYDYYVKYKGFKWDKPKFKKESRLFFLPYEQELDLLINNARFKMGTFLLLLKETGMDCGEAWNLKWIDIDVVRKTVNVTPVKNHNGRVLPISDVLLSRLLRLPRKNDRVFSSKSLDRFRSLYERYRNKLAVKLNNERLKYVQLRSFRHWKGTQLYSETKDIMYVKWFLGHKRIENTMVYVHLVNFESNQYITKVAKTLSECEELVKLGYEFVCNVDGFKLFRKRK